jgi:hypothetical protein
VQAEPIDDCDLRAGINPRLGAVRQAGSFHSQCGASRAQIRNRAGPCKEWPNAIRIEHHKTGELVWHPLEETVGDVTTKFFEDAEAVLAYLPRRGVPMILREVVPPRSRPDQNPTSKLFSFSGFEKIIQCMRAELELPSTFTLDACPHGGMTELEVAEPADGQGRALSGHKTRQSYAGYAKQTLERALPATRKRYAHRLGNVERTKFQNNGQNSFQNDRQENNS